MTDSERATANVQSPKRCEWRAGTECPFGNKPSLVDFDGQSYCIYHLPLDATKKPKEPQQYQDLLDKHRNRDLSGVQFPAGLYEVHSTETISVIEHCKFADKIQLKISGGKFSFDRSEFLGSVEIRSENAQVSLCGVNFRGKLTLQADNSHTARRWVIEKSTFRAEVDFSKTCFDETLSLNGSTFLAPVWFGGKTIFPQQTTADGTTFKPGALTKDCEGSYRAARSAFAAHRNREIEGKFYALEKRCQRKTLVGSWRKPCSWLNLLSRVFSKVYDISSEYGQSYERALLLLACVQVAFGISYSCLARRFSFGGDFDWLVALFTFSPIVKPFEMLGAREPSKESVYGIILEHADRTLLAALTTVHSFVSLTLVALFLFALSWRFRRE